MQQFSTDPYGLSYGLSAVTLCMCMYWRMASWTKYLRQWVSVVVVCHCPDEVLHVDEWSFKTEHGFGKMEQKDLRVLFPNRCPPDPDWPF